MIEKSQIKIIFRDINIIQNLNVMNEVLLEISHIHCITNCLWLLCVKMAKFTSVTGTIWPAKPKKRTYPLWI